VCHPLGVKGAQIAGWRFLDALGHEDVWHDPALLDLGE